MAFFKFYRFIKPGDLLVSEDYEAVVLGTPTPEGIHSCGIIDSLNIDRLDVPKVAPGILCY